MNNQTQELLFDNLKKLLKNSLNDIYNNNNNEMIDCLYFKMNSLLNIMPFEINQNILSF